MNSPWDISEKAFEPMFDESVIISCTRNGQETSQTVKCFVATAATGEPYTEDMIDTARVDMSFSFARKDWAFIQTVRRGDKVTRCGLLKKLSYIVQDVTEDDVMGLVITARGA